MIHQENGGLSAARNAGIDWVFANSDSEWITFIDSDDWVYPQYLEYLYRAASENNAEISACGTVYEKNDTHTMKPQYYSAKKMTAEKYWIDNNGEVSVAWEKLYRKQLFTDTRFPVGMIYEDEFTTYKVLFSAGTIAVVTNCLYIYYFSETSILRSRWNEKKFANMRAVLEQIEYFRTYGNYKIVDKLESKLADIIKLDYSIINEEPNKYQKYKKILDDEIEDSFKKQFPQYASLPIMRGWLLRRWIVWRKTMIVYVDAIFRRL